MANLTNTPALLPGDTTKVFTTADIQLGTRAWDPDGNEFVFVNGITSAAAGTAAVYDELYVTTLAVSGSVGPVGIFKAACTSGTYGWLQTRGKALTVKLAASCDDNGVVYTTATAGYLSSVTSSQTQIKGAAFRSAGTSGGTATLQLTFPTATMS
jgi:hypothetical protein